MIDVTRIDLNRSTELLKVLNRAKYEVEGNEALALAQVLNWAAAFHGRIEADVKAQDAAQEAKIKAALEAQATAAKTPPPADPAPAVTSASSPAPKGPQKRK